MRTQTQKFISYLQDNSIDIIEMTVQEQEEHKQEWFRNFIPSEKRQQAIDGHCFDKDDYCGYLWHVFSYNILDYLSNREAESAFDCVSKSDAILLVNWPERDGIASCRLKNISNITANILALLTDVILTDSDFSWTYVKTHESKYGPYFHTTCKN